jgi:hypothetical protein
MPIEEEHSKNKMIMEEYSSKHLQEEDEIWMLMK